MLERFVKEEKLDSILRGCAFDEGILISVEKKGAVFEKLSRISPCVTAMAQEYLVTAKDNDVDVIANGLDSLLNNCNRLIRETPDEEIKNGFKASVIALLSEIENELGNEFQLLITQKKSQLLG